MKKSNSSKAGAGIVAGSLLIAGMAFAATASGSATSTTAPSAAVVVVSGAAATSSASAGSGVATVAAAATGSAATGAAVRPLTGVNISGGEFGTVPGRNGYDYSYPSAAEIDYFVGTGARIVRIPFRWERLQPVLYGPLSAGDRSGLLKAVTYARSKGLTVVLDMHDYARRRAIVGIGTSVAIGTVDLGESALADAWNKIAADYRDDAGVWLGLMNEPSGLGIADWWRSAQQLVIDLRNQRIANKLLVPGGSWTGAHSWISSGNAAQAARFTDPGRNFAFELHQYLDKDSSGTSAICTVGAAKRVDAVLAWAKAAGVPLFFGEIAAGPGADCQVEYDAMLRKLNTSGSVIGWTAWGGGKWWNAAYMFRLASVAGATSPHMAMVQRNFVTG